jgi:hypothetical protein
LATSDERQQDKTSEWNELNQYAVGELSEIVDTIIDKLASELNLKANTLDHASVAATKP